MQQQQLFEDAPCNATKNPVYSLGNGFFIDLQKGYHRQAILSRHGHLIKVVDLSDKVAKKMFVVEAVNLGVQQNKLAAALEISRQTIHNYLEVHQHFGIEGLTFGYNPKVSLDLAQQRARHADALPTGNKAVQVAEIRVQERQQQAEATAVQRNINFCFGEDDSVADEAPAFIEQHDWQRSRYAGLFIYWITLIFQSRWLQLIMTHFGAGWRIFAVFLLMAAHNIRSIEQLKHVRSREAGIALGLGTVPAKSVLWTWFYQVADQGLARQLLNDYFRHQIRAGLVSTWGWFTDGHLLPYTGKDKVHYSYNTQRRMPVPGRTSQVTCDHTGRIVDFMIDEGKGEMKQWILTVGEKWQSETGQRALMVFDREGYDQAFFSTLVQAEQAFVTWQKNVDSTQLLAIDDSDFKLSFTFNNKAYSVIETTKDFSYSPEKNRPPHTFTLRRLILWNRSSKRRTSLLTYGDHSTLDAACAILNRWGASENTFKHLQTRHPLHYHPGFALSESDRQDLANPEIKKQEKIMTRISKGIARLHRKLFKSPEQTKKDGTPRSNSQRQRLEHEIRQQQAELERVTAEKKQLPDRIDVSTLEDYRSYKKIDNEGKYLFDFVTTAVWNARKQMIDWLGDYYESDNDRVDLFYAISHCQGWIRSTATEVRVRLEPLQQARRRAAQEQLCRKLTAFGAQTPTGKLIVIEVGESPVK